MGGDKFKKKENPEKTAITLASALLAAGITVSTENMVALFESIQINTYHRKQGF